MKVRTKFTLWIALTSLFAAILFSIFVYDELLEEPHKLITRELLDTAEAILNNTEIKTKPVFHPEKSDYPLERYYVKLMGAEQTIIYASSLAKQIDIPAMQTNGFQTVTRDYSPKKVWLDPLNADDEEELKGNKTRFRVVQISRMQGEQKLTLILAKPLAMLSAEVQDLLHELFIYIIITILLIVMISYYLAGKLLKPIAEINSRVKDIRETSLDKRIPLGKSEDELHILTVSLNSMFDRLQYSFKQQKEFISNASHEMKIPLTITILGHEEMLSRDLPEGVHNELARQLANLQRLNKLVKDLLDISHLEHREYLERSNLNLSLLIEKVLEDFDEMIKAANITCETKVERLRISGDQEKMVRVFINLIDNAIKYNTADGGKIMITVQQLDQTAKVSISNTGQDIPPQDLPNIFNQFYRVEKSRAIQYGGSGLGLTIVKRIVELHGGTIQAASKNGETIFTFTLPLH